MTRPVPSSDDQESISSPDGPAAERPSLERLADLIAAGEAPCPAALPGRDRDDLVRLVRRRLGRRLVRFLARQIARDLHRRDHPEE